MDAPNTVQTATPILAPVLYVKSEVYFKTQPAYLALVTAKLVYQSMAPRRLNAYNASIHTFKIKILVFAPYVAAIKTHGSDVKAHKIFPKLQIYNPLNA